MDLVATSRRSAFQFPRIQHLLDELPVCRFQFAGDSKLEQDELVVALRHATDTQRLVLPTFTCAYEAQLMREAGTFRIGGRAVAFPECRFGARCVGRATGTHAIIGLGSDGAGVTLMALLFEGELATLLDTGTVDLRGNKRPCLLCYRHLLCDFLFSLQPRHSAPLGSTCIQIYSNLQVLRPPPLSSDGAQDEPGGYQSQYMLNPARTHYNGIVAPIVMYQPQLLRGRLDPEQCRWVVDQDVIVWQPPPDPAPRVSGTPLGLFARHVLAAHRRRRLLLPLPLPRRD